MVPIPPRFRVALAAKGLLLLSLAAVFLVLGFAAWGQQPWPVLVRLGVFGFAVLTTRFLGWAAGLALLDAVQGRAERSSGATPLPSRRSGRSLRLSSGRFVEYILVNPWQPLEQGARYTVTYGRRSGVLVAPPEREG
jgi:hypothetical protein